MERIKTLSQLQEVQLQRLETHADVVNIRRTGTIAAFDLITADDGHMSDVGPTLYRYFLNHDVLLRPYGNTVYVLSPYCISEDDLIHVYDVIEEAMDFVRNGGEKRAA
jgi:adenosylmethionine-8-amino-7-oxononanoate aminotransferase